MSPESAEIFHSMLLIIFAVINTMAFPIHLIFDNFALNLDDAVAVESHSSSLHKKIYLFDLSQGNVNIYE